MDFSKRRQRKSLSPFSRRSAEGLEVRLDPKLLRCDFDFVGELLPPPVPPFAAKRRARRTCEDVSVSRNILTPVELARGRVDVDAVLALGDDCWRWRWSGKIWRMSRCRPLAVLPMAKRRFNMQMSLEKQFGRARVRVGNSWASFDITAEFLEARSPRMRINIGINVRRGVRGITI